MRVKKHNRRDGHPHHHHHHHHHHSRGKTRRNTTTPSFRAPRLSPSESIAQTTATLRVLKRDGTFDRIRDRLVRSILQNETLKTYAQFAVTASTRIMASRFNNDTTTTGGRRRSDDGEDATTTQKPSSVKFDAETKMAVKREVERDLSREVSNAAWQVLAERDGDVPRAIQSEIFRERKMRHEAKERKEEMKKKEKKKKRREGRRPTTLL